MPKAALATAAKFAEVAKKAGGIFAFPTIGTKITHAECSSAEIASRTRMECACKDCSTVFATFKTEGLQPYCIACGSDNVQDKGASKASIPDDKELSFVECSCGASTILQREIARIGPCHCVTCGSQLKMKANADLNEDVDLDLDLDSEDTDSAEDMPVIDVTAEEDPAPAPTPTKVDVVNDIPDDNLNLDLDLQETDADTDSEDDLDEDEFTEDESEPDQNEEAQDESLDDDAVEINLLEETPDELPEDETASFVYDGDGMGVLIRGNIIARLTRDKAGEHAKILQTESFRKAVAHSITSMGLKKALANYGFESVKIRAPVSKIVAKRVKQKVQAATAKLQAERASLVEDFSQSLDIAAAGFAGNFWRKPDKLKEALIAELNTIGVKGAAKFVDRIFASHGVEHFKQVLDMAKELNTKPLEARNALADAIDMAKYRPTETAKSDVEDEKETAITIGTATDDVQVKPTRVAANTGSIIGGILANSGVNKLFL